MMTSEHVRERVARIEANKRDDERAHSDEDELHRDVLREIANGANDPAALAREALSSERIEFHRWCA